MEVRLIDPTKVLYNKYYGTDWRNPWDMFYGFKDGVIGVTGNNSKASYCDRNLTDAYTVYFKNFADLFKDDATIATNFNDANKEASMRAFFTYVRNTLQWPFFTLYSCYWMTALLYVPYIEWDLPNIFAYQGHDEYDEFTVMD